MRRFLLVLAILFLSSVSSVAYAQMPGTLGGDFHIIPDASELDPSCPEGAPLSFGAVMAVAQSALSIAISFGVLICIVIMAWAGFILVLSPFNAEGKSKARTMLTNAGIGLLIVLSSWLIVDFVMKTLYSGPDGTKGKFGPWNSILGDGPACVTKSDDITTLFSGAITAEQVKALSGENDGSVPSGTVTNGAGCPGNDCVSLAPEVPCSASGCKVDKGLKQALIAARAKNSGWTVTEAYPPSRVHKAACHKNGTCVDVGLRPQTYTVSTVSSFYSAASSAGLRPVFESKSQALVNSLKQKGINAVYLGEWITADHFSVYSK